MWWKGVHIWIQKNKSFEDLKTLLEASYKIADLKSFDIVNIIFILQEAGFDGIDSNGLSIIEDQIKYDDNELEGLMIDDNFIKDLMNGNPYVWWRCDFNNKSNDKEWLVNFCMDDFYAIIWSWKYEIWENRGWLWWWSLRCIWAGVS